MSSESRGLRALINDRLALFADPRFDYHGATAPPLDPWSTVMTQMVALHNEKAAFLRSSGYNWTLDREAYNSPFEALLQWRLLNAVSDMRGDHPALKRCANLVVRVLPTSCARPQLRQVEQYHVILLANGYLSAFKGFIRLWLRGCALGGAKSNPPANYAEYASAYSSALQTSSEAMTKSTLAYVGTLFQLLANVIPSMDGGSVFDGVILKKEDWMVQFGLLGTAIDGFVLFHETAHVLGGDTHESERTLECELEADRGSVSLCIIDEARSGGVGTVHLGSPMFYCVELLRLLCEEILEFRAGNHNPASGRYPGIDELIIRAQLYGEHVGRYLGPKVLSLHAQWSAAITLVFDTVRWGLLHGIGVEQSLSEFVAAK